MRRALVRVGTVLFAVLLAMQFIPLSRTNPPATREVRWDTPATRALVRRTCFDCHTNETEWPWYSHVAPASFLVISHVNDGRRRLNFSEWDTPQRATFSDVEDNVTRGEMPIWNYVIVHQQAKLTPAETTRLLDGLRATFRQDPPIARPR
jgi:mono/diheme cytochrome c family protein